MALVRNPETETTAAAVRAIVLTPRTLFSRHRQYRVRAERISSAVDALARIRAAISTLQASHTYGQFLLTMPSSTHQR